MKISFIGDVMLGRFVREKYEKKSYELVSNPVKSIFKDSNYVVANLESVITKDDETDSLKFAGDSKLLEQFKWVNCFSLSNNHINDYGDSGMESTLEQLKVKGFESNGLYQSKYHPVLVEKEGEKVAIITCADMMNYEFSENCPYNTLRVNRPDEIITYIKEYKEKGYIIILYAHVGMLFTRFPNPVIRDFVHQMIDDGADCVVTAHPHCIGGAEYYKGKLIVYSLGDFLMDGSSFRRRKAGILNLNIDKGQINEWDIVPVFTNDELIVCLPDENGKKKIMDSFDFVSNKISQHTDNYKGFYKKQYKKELLAHSLSTISFEYHRRGLMGLFQILKKRIGAVKQIIKRVFTDRSSMSYDSDAVSQHNISIKEIR